MGFSTNECAWHQTTVNVLGRNLKGVHKVSYKKKVDKERVYGAGQQPIDINEGNEEVDGSLDLLKYEVDMFNDAALAVGASDMLGIPHTAVTIVITYKKTITSPVRTTTITGVAFTELPADLDQAAKFTKMTVPFIAMGLLMR